MTRLSIISSRVWGFPITKSLLLLPKERLSFFSSAITLNFSATFFTIFQNNIFSFFVSSKALILERSSRSFTKCNKLKLLCSALVIISLDLSEIEPVKLLKTTFKQLWIAEREACKSWDTIKTYCDFKRSFSLNLSFASQRAISLSHNLLTIEVVMYTTINKVETKTEKIPAI